MPCYAVEPALTRDRVSLLVGILVHTDQHINSTHVLTNNTIPELEAMLLILRILVLG